MTIVAHHDQVCFQLGGAREQWADDADLGLLHVNIRRDTMPHQPLMQRVEAQSLGPGGIAACLVPDHDMNVPCQAEKRYRIRRPRGCRSTPPRRWCRWCRWCRSGPRSEESASVEHCGERLARQSSASGRDRGRQDRPWSELSGRCNERDAQTMRLGRIPRSPRRTT